MQLGISAPGVGWGGVGAQEGLRLGGWRQRLDHSRAGRQELAGGPEMRQ